MNKIKDLRSKWIKNSKNGYKLYLLNKMHFIYTHTNPKNGLNKLYDERGIIWLTNFINNSQEGEELVYE